MSWNAWNDTDTATIVLPFLLFHLDSPFDPDENKNTHCQFMDNLDEKPKSSSSLD